MLISDRRQIARTGQANDRNDFSSVFALGNFNGIPNVSFLIFLAGKVSRNLREHDRASLAYPEGSFTDAENDEL